MAQETQLQAILTEGGCWACVCFCKPRSSLSTRLVSAAAAAPTTARTFPPHARGRMTRPGIGSARHLRPPHPRARDGGAVFLLPSPFPKPLLLLRGCGFLLRRYRNDRRTIQSECDSSSKTRPLMVPRFLPAHTGVTSEERTAMKREGGAAHLCSDSLPESQQQNGNHAPNFSSHSSCRRRQRRRHDKALHAR